MYAVYLCLSVHVRVDFMVGFPAGLCLATRSDVWQDIVLSLRTNEISLKSLVFNVHKLDL